MKRKTAATAPPAGAKRKAGGKPSSGDTKRKGKAGPFLVKRRHLRFRPDPMEYAQVAIQDSGGPFAPDLVALVSEEAPMGGCGLVLLETPTLKVGDVCRVKVGRIDPLRAQVMWRRAVEPGLIRLGLKFLE